MHHTLVQRSHRGGEIRGCMIHTCLLNGASLDDIHSHFFIIEIKPLLLKLAVLVVASPEAPRMK